jgi:hypothetical protein
LHYTIDIDYTIDEWLTNRLALQYLRRTFADDAASRRRLGNESRRLFVVCNKEESKKEHVRSFFPESRVERPIFGKREHGIKRNKIDLRDRT